MGKTLAAGAWPALLSLSLCLGCATESHRSPGFCDRMGLVSYDPKPSEIRRILPLLKERELGLGFNMRPNTDRDEAAAIVRMAAADGVPVGLVCEIGIGAFANTSNWREYSEWTCEVMDFVEANGLPVGGLIIDMEPSFSRLTRLRRDMSRGGNRIGLVLEYLTEKLTDPEYEAAHAGYRKLVEEAHERGFRVVLTTVPFVLDDMEDGDPTLQRCMECPVAGIEWDQIAFQVYSTIYRDIIGTRDSSVLASFVNDYAKSAKKHFGDRGAVAIGLLPDRIAWPGQGYDSPEGLEADVRAATAAGLPLSRIHPYALEGLLRDDNPARWFEWDLDSPRMKYQPDLTLVLLRTTLRTFDQNNN